MHFYKGDIDALALQVATDQTNPAVKTKIVLVNERPDPWVPDQWNVLGLSPNSDFLSILRTNN